MHLLKVALYSISGVMPIRYHILRNRINLKIFIDSLPPGRWSKKALNQQLSWAREDGLIENSDQFNPSAINKGGISYYYKEMVKSLRNKHLRALKFQNKNDVRIFIRGMCNKELKETIQSKSTLVFFDYDWCIVDYDFHSLKHKWWLKAKCGAIFLNY